MGPLLPTAPKVKLQEEGGVDHQVKQIIRLFHVFCLLAPGLVCVNDFVNTVTCAWHGAAQAPGANCSISGVEKIWIGKRIGSKRGQITYFPSLVLTFPLR